MANIYLDSAAMSPVLPIARKAFLDAPFGNPSSEHAVGVKARNALENAREKIARLMECGEDDRIIFTSTATEAAALVSYSLANHGCGIVADEKEHHSILENEGVFPYKPDGCWPRSCAAQMLANNETGFINTERPDISYYQYGWLCDATAAVGHIPVSFRELGCAYMIFDSIKFGGVPGAAALIAKQNAPLSPLIRGGGQERGMRSGTENVPAICAMAAALEWQTEHMDENTQKIGALRAMMFKMLSEIPNHKWNTPFNKPCVPHILNISFDGVDAHALAMLLSKQGVMVSPGAACSNGLHEPSHVILAMFNDEERARSAVRISMSHENTADEIVEASQKIKEAVAYLRSLS